MEVKAIEILAQQGFLPVRRAPLCLSPASHAGGRWFESISLHQVIRTLWINGRKVQWFQGVRSFLRPKIFKVFDGSMETAQRFKQGLNLCAVSIFKKNISVSALFQRAAAARFRINRRKIFHKVMGAGLLVFTNQ